MMPGVTYFPAPSITNASAGALTVTPTAAIFPFCIRIAPFLISGPAAVKMLTFLITVVRAGNGTYVLGNGSALGAEVAPRPNAWDESRAGDADVVVCDEVDAHAAAPTKRRLKKARM